jgi:hypothetical protein
MEIIPPPAAPYGDPIDPRNADDRPLGRLMRDLSADSMHLIKSEAELFRLETEKRIAKLERRAALLGAGAFVAYVGVLALVAALILGLGTTMPLWGAALLVGAVLAVGGVGSVFFAKKKLEAEDLVPRESVRSVKQDIRTVQEAWR